MECRLVWLCHEQRLSHEPHELDVTAGYGRMADIWSFGCVVLEMLTARSPWPPLGKCTGNEIGHVVFLMFLRVVSLKCASLPGLINRLSLMNTVFLLGL